MQLWLAACHPGFCQDPGLQHDFPVYAPATTNVQSRLPVVVADSQGEFAIAWVDTPIEADDHVLLREFDPCGGQLVDPPIPVDQVTETGSPSPPADIAVSANGTLVVVWRILRGESSEIWSRAFNADGQPLAQEVRVDDSSCQVTADYPAVAWDPAGSFVVVWWQSPCEPSPAGVHARRLDGSGVPAGIGFRVDTDGHRVKGLDVAVDAGANVLFAWTDTESVVLPNETVQDVDKVLARSLDSASNFGEPFRVDEEIIGYPLRSGPSVAAGSAGAFAIAWSENNDPDPEEASKVSVKYRRLLPAGGTGAAVALASEDSMPFNGPCVALDGKGFALVGFHGPSTGDPQESPLVVRRASPDDTSISEPIRVGDSAHVSDESQPGIAVFSDGRFICAWHYQLAESSESHVYASMQMPAPAMESCLLEGDGSVRLAWTKQCAYDEIRVQRKLQESTAPYETIHAIQCLDGACPGSGSYVDATTDCSLSGASDYEYRVVGVIQGTEFPSEPCLVSIFRPPSNFFCKQVGDEVHLSWENRCAYEKISILRDGQPYQTVGGLETGFVDAGLCCLTYKYEIQAEGPSSPEPPGEGDGALPSCSIEFVCDAILLSCSRGEGKTVQLTWSTGTSFEKYSIVRTLEGQPAEIGTATSGETSYLDLEAPPGLVSYHVVGTRCSTERFSEPCPVYILAAPTRLDCTWNGTTVELAWADGKGTAQEVWRDTEQIATLGADERQFTDTDVSAGPRVYSIRAVAPEHTQEWAESPPCAVDCLMFPVHFTCQPAEVGRGVELRWTNQDTYESLEIRREDFFGNIVSFKLEETDASMFTDADVPQGSYKYTLVARARGESAEAGPCHISVVHFPTGLACSLVERDSGVHDARLVWDNQGCVYDTLTVQRNNEAPVALDGKRATSYLDENVPEGVLKYKLEAKAFGRSGTQECQLVLVPDGGQVPLPMRAGVDLGEVDAEGGLHNVRDVEDGDGENIPLFCGPQASSRACRRNLGGADKYFYFRVLDGELRRKPHFLAFAVLYDDPSFKDTGAEIRLEYTKDPAAESNGEAGAFTPATEVHELEGSSKWVTLAWQLVDAAFREPADGALDFRIVVGGGARICLDQALILESPAPPDLRPSFRRGDCDGDARVHLTDAIYKLNYLFKSGPAPLCEDAADFNDDGRLNITGAIFLLLYLFDAGAVPGLPGPLTCGPDETPDALREPCLYRVCQF